MKKIIIFLTITFVSFISLIIYIDHNTPKGYKYLIPEGYNGKLVINYHIEKGETLKTEDGFKVIKFNNSGKINLLNKRIIGKTKDKFIVYSDNNISRTLREDELAGGYTIEESGKFSSIFFVRTN